MEMQVLGWKYKNIRGGMRDVEIDLRSPLPRWTLIQMPNGTGKTTTMQLFRAVLAGEELPPDVVRDLRSSDKEISGFFEIRVKLDSKLHRIRLNLDYREGTHSYSTVRSEIQGGGVEEGVLLPRELRRLFTSDFVRLFVFDGELAKEIRAVGKERASNAIRTLYRLDRIDTLGINIERIVTAHQQAAAAVSTATEMRGLNRWRNLLDSVKAARKSLIDQLARLKRDQASTSKQLNEVSDRISKHIQQDTTLNARKQELVSQQASIEKEIAALTAESIVLFRAPAKIHDRILQRLHSLADKLTHLKLPKTISEEFFRELAEQKECVCGRPIDDEAHSAILQRAPLYLADDQIAIINQMKRALRESSGDESEYGKVVTELRDKLRALRSNKVAQDQLELERVEAGDTELEQLRSEQSRLTSRATEIATSIERIETKDPTKQRALNLSYEDNLPSCESELERCERKIGAITNTRQFMKKGAYVQTLLKDISTSALDSLRDRVTKSTNEKLKQLIPSESLRIARIGGALELKSGAVAQKSGVSEGQSLAVAYAFLSSLLSDAPYKLPFIVDSPAVSLDTKVRREVGDLIPPLFNQMIIFVISSERDGFADAFYDRNDTRFITLWRDSEDMGTTIMKDGLKDFQTFHSREDSR